jgi:hypothetical protein
MPQDAKDTNKNDSSSLDLGPPDTSPSQDTTTAITPDGTDFTITGGEVNKGDTIILIDDPISNRDIAIAAVSVIIAMVLFFFLKRAFELWCVNRRVSPNRASLAGNSLFIGLTLLAVGIALYVLRPDVIYNLIVSVPIALLALAAFVTALINSRK